MVVLCRRTLCIVQGMKTDKEMETRTNDTALNDDSAWNIRCFEMIMLVEAQQLEYFDAKKKSTGEMSKR